MPLTNKQAVEAFNERQAALGRRKRPLPMSDEEYEQVKKLIAAMRCIVSSKYGEEVE